MKKLQIYQNQRTFIKDGRPFFYLADTCWSAFTNITMEDWAYYLNVRKEQGFNVLQINILPQWDASGTPLAHYPFPTKDKRIFSFTSLDDAYFERAKRMCQMAEEQGFTLALVVLWCNYVPNTWASNMMKDNILPYEYLDTYIKKVYETFHDLDVVYVMSGDTDFSPESNVYYERAFSLLKAYDPQALYTMHIKGRLDEIPKQFIPFMDFYMFQSGHNAQIENRNTAISLAQSFYQSYPVKPILNSEPCYEQMSFSHHMYGKFYPFDIRRAAWMSLLSGACAGVTYGAHGIYSWHCIDQSFGSGLGEGFNRPNPWQKAILYPGAWDYGYIKHIFESYAIRNLVPITILAKENFEIRSAIDKEQDLILIYVPVGEDIFLEKQYASYDVIAIDLVHKNIAYPTIQTLETSARIAMHCFEQDCLYILKKR